MEFYVVLGVVALVVTLEGWRLYDYLVNKRRDNLEFEELREEYLRTKIQCEYHRGLVLMYMDKAASVLGEEGAVEELNALSATLTSRVTEEIANKINDLTQ